MEEAEGRKVAAEIAGDVERLKGRLSLWRGAKLVRAGGGDRCLVDRSEGLTRQG